MLPLVRAIESISGSASATLTTASTGLLHISGQPRSPVSGEVPAHHDSQVLLLLLNLHQALLAVGGSIAGITRLTLYIVNYNPQQHQQARHVQRFLRSHNPIITSFLSLNSQSLNGDSSSTLKLSSPLPFRGQCPPANRRHGMSLSSALVCPVSRRLINSYTYGYFTKAMLVFKALLG
ncbi:uncharacterized protein ACHE_30768S [Aspergillus chevalieri]|uniref:Uncharacterized protein n=1 Tax=Aspergillus chevalieri TaxID=182096 RepID=A0A7R7ZMS3_ASPCH|nr:uncharacterized protein ACHE_30768S [Aspergillus chevalieri]BCR86781.1 hypothetical protein ACHE_30768S [Aspergillus chevalieri]